MCSGRGAHVDGAEMCNARVHAHMALLNFNHRHHHHQQKVWRKGCMEMCNIEERPEWHFAEFNIHILLLGQNNCVVLSKHIS